MVSIREYIDIVKQNEQINEADEVIDRPPVRTPQKDEAPVHLPGGFTVVILNDPVTPAEVVVDAIVFGARLSPDEAMRRMMRAHRKGWVPVASYASRDMAETVAARIEQHARSNKNYDHYRPYIPYMGRMGYTGPWPLTTEVMEANKA